MAEKVEKSQVGDNFASLPPLTLLPPLLLSPPKRKGEKGILLIKEEEKRRGENKKRIIYLGKWLRATAPTGKRPPSLFFFAFSRKVRRRRRRRRAILERVARAAAFQSSPLQDNETRSTRIEVQCQPF